MWWDRIHRLTFQSLIVASLCLLKVDAVCRHSDLVVPEYSEQLSITVKANYSTDDIALFDCADSKASSFGHVVIRCQSTGIWGQRDRDCTDPAEVGPATILGFCLFSLTAVLEFVMIGVTTYRHRKAQKKDDWKRRLELAAASYGDSSCTASEAGDVYEVKSARTKQSDC